VCAYARVICRESALLYIERDRACAKTRVSANAREKARQREIEREREAGWQNLQISGTSVQAEAPELAKQEEEVKFKEKKP